MFSYAFGSDESTALDRRVLNEPTKLVTGMIPSRLQLVPNRFETGTVERNCTVCLTGDSARWHF